MLTMAGPRVFGATPLDLWLRNEHPQGVPPRRERAAGRAGDRAGGRAGERTIEGELQGELVAGLEGGL